jgi:predicted MFS family arabinose efflux permease
MMLDRIGPRHTLFPLMFVTVAATVCFALSPTVLLLEVSRFVMGIGCAAAYIGATVVCARWFSGDRFAAASGVVLATGNVGAILATSPLAWSAHEVGWRDTFLISAAIAFAGSAWAYAVVRDAPPGHAFHSRKPERLRDTLAGLRQVVTDTDFLRVLMVGFTNYPVVVAVLGLWGAPFLFDVHGMDAVERGNVLLIMAVSTVAGFLLYGQLDRLLDTRKWLIVGGLSASIAVLLALALAPRLPVWLTAALFAALGLFGSFNSVSLAHGRALFRPQLVGRMAAMYNLSVQGGVGVLQLATGWLLAAFPATAGRTPETAYSALFLALAALGLIALAVYAPLRDAKPSADRDR